MTRAGVAASFRRLMEPTAPIEPTPPRTAYDTPPRDAQIMATSMWIATLVSVGIVMLMHADGIVRSVIISLGAAVVLALNVPLVRWLMAAFRADGFNRRIVMYGAMMLLRLSLATWIFLMADAGKLLVRQH